MRNTSLVVSWPAGSFCMFVFGRSLAQFPVALVHLSISRQKHRLVSWSGQPARASAEELISRRHVGWSARPPISQSTDKVHPAVASTPPIQPPIRRYKTSATSAHQPISRSIDTIEDCLRISRSAHQPISVKTALARKGTSKSADNVCPCAQASADLLIS